MDNLEKILKAIEEERIIWRKHSIMRMLERNIKRNEVLSCIRKGKSIHYYESDYQTRIKK
jgi:hypothetical protein